MLSEQILAALLGQPLLCLMRDAVPHWHQFLSARAVKKDFEGMIAQVQEHDVGIARRTFRGGCNGLQIENAGGKELGGRARFRRRNSPDVPRLRYPVT